MSTQTSDDMPKRHSLVVQQLEDVAPSENEASHTTLWQELKRVRPLFPRLLIIYLSVISIGIDNALAGFSIGIPAFRRQFGDFMGDEVGYVIPANYISAWGGAGVGMQTLGALLSGYIADKFGRRWALRISAMIVIVSAAMMISARKIGLLIASKALLGFGTGFLISQAAPYLAECAPIRLRGIAIAGINVFMVFGQWLGAILIFAASESFPDVNDNTSWLLVFGLQFVFPTLFLAFSIIVPESPVYLVQMGRINDAVQSARKYFGERYDYQAHVDRVTVEVRHENAESAEGESISFWEPWQGTNLRRTLVGIMVVAGQVLTGSFFILGYQNYFYELANIPSSNALNAGNFSVALVACICSYFVIEPIGRRRLYTGGALILGISNLLVGFMSILQQKDAKTAGTVAVFGLYLWQVVFQTTVGPVAWVVMGELPSNRLRAKTSAWISLFNSLISFGISYAIPQLFNPDAANLGLKMGYIFGSTACTLSVVCWMFLPETKGRSSLELDYLFENKTPTRGFRHAKFDATSLNELDRE